MTKHAQIAITTNGPVTWEPRGNISPAQAGVTVCSFLDAAATSFGRATHYNTQEEQQKAEIHNHAAMLRMDRDLYTLFLTLPGVTDRSRQLGIRNLLAECRNGENRILDEDGERQIVHGLMHNLPATRMLKLFTSFPGIPEVGIPRINNARTRKLILNSVLGSRALELWAVKYRHKIRDALVHAFGRRKASYLREILRKDPGERNAQEIRILRREIGRYAGTSGQRMAKAYECVGFVLGVRDGLTLPLFRAFLSARDDLTTGKKLPTTVLEGIRSTFHKDTPKEEVLRLTAESMTKAEKLATQKRAKEAGVELDINPLDYEAVKLYIYAFETGMTSEIAEALDKKAHKAAQGFPARYEQIAVIVDSSRSMVGDRTQKLRPMATTLACRDMLRHIAQNARVVYAGGSFNDGDVLVRPSGDTALADALVDILAVDERPEAIFVLSDGYENAPAGRFGEVVEAVREIGIDTPIFHMNPVFAAESTGVRTLAENSVPTLPVRDPEGVGLSFIRGLLESEPVRGINALLSVALKPALKEA